MPTTMTYTGTLAITSCWCGITYAIPRDLDSEALRDGTEHRGVYCPLGHKWVYTGKTEAERLKEQLRWERDRLAAVRAERDGAQASLRATKGHVTRLRKSVLSGVCPLCHQTLRDLKRHVGRVHPNEPVELPEVI